MLLSIQNRSRDTLSHMVGNIVPKNKRDILPFLDLDASNEAFAMHARTLHFLEHDDGAALLVFAVVHCHIELELDVLAMEGRYLALGANTGV